MSFSRGFQTTITDFARSMELEPLEVGDGSYSFDFERGGRLSFVSADDGSVLISLTRRLLIEDARNLALCAGLAGIDAYEGTACHAGVNKAGQPVLTLRLAETGLDVPRVEGAYMTLSQKFESIGF